MASTGTIQKDFSLLCTKDNLSDSDIEKLPEEILFEIFTYFGLKDLGRCLQVSKGFRKISKDKKLWQRITLFRKEVPIEFIGQALTFGLKHLSFEECILQRNLNTDIGMMLDLYPKKNELKSLDLTDFYYRKTSKYKRRQYKYWNPKYLDKTELNKYVTALLESCHSLEKLYLDHNCPKCIAQNGQTLIVLNLMMYDLSHNHPGSVQLIIENCTELKELALFSLESADFSFVCKKLTPTIHKLRIRSHSGNRIDNDKDVEILTKRCHNLTVLNLAAKVTKTSITNIIKNLSMSLEKLELRHQEDIVEILELRSMSKLKLLFLKGKLSSREKKIQQKYFESNLPHLKVVLCNYRESTEDVMGIAVQEGKRQKSELDLFRDIYFHGAPFH